MIRRRLSRRMLCFGETKTGCGTFVDEWRSRTASSDSIFSEKRGVAASTEFGMNNLLEVGRVDNEDPAWLKHWHPK